MWTKLISSIALPMLGGLAKWALGKLPIERLIAWLLNMWLRRIDQQDMDRVVRSAKHISELANLLADIVADRQITVKEATDAKTFIMSLREDLLNEYAAGRTAKSLEKALNGASN